MRTLKCDMKHDCARPVTHIDEKGFIYCAEHGQQRRNHKRCRKLQGWELQRLLEGKTVPSYKPISLKEFRTIRCAGCRLCAADLEERPSDLCGCAFMLDDVEPGL